jgi:hypothetical protein
MSRKTRIRRASRRAKRRVSRRVSRRVLRKVKTYYGGVGFFDKLKELTQLAPNLTQAREKVAELAAQVNAQVKQKTAELTGLGQAKVSIQ